MADAAGILTRLGLWLSEFYFDIVHKVGTKKQASATLSRPKKRGKNNIYINNYIPVAIINLDEDKNETA